MRINMAVEYISPKTLSLEESMILRDLKLSKRESETNLFMVVSSPKKYIHDFGIDKYIELTEEIKSTKCYEEFELVRKNYIIAKRWISQYQRKHNN